MTVVKPARIFSAWGGWIRTIASMLTILAVLCGPGLVVAAPAQQALAPEIISSGAADGSVVWGDIDNDGDQDLLVTGRGESEAMTTLLLGNSDGSLALVGSAGLPRVEASSLALADFDGDGDLDVLITGQRGVTLSGELGLARVYQNDGGAFFTLYQELTGVYRGAAEWGDYDRDGDLDILLTGYQDGGEGFGALYRNDQGIFVIDEQVTIPAVGDSALAWGDYDADGDLDFVVMGKLSETSSTRVAQVYQNDGNGAFSAIDLTVNGLWNGTANWIDIEPDGDLDLIVTGNNGPDSFNRDPVTLLFVVDSTGGFTQAEGSGLPNIWQSSVSVGDYDNDGDPDLLINGQTTTENLTQILINQAGSFSDSGQVISGGTGASVAWGHLDGDGSLDAVVSGGEGPDARRSTYLYTNLPDLANTAPSTPAAISACWDGTNSVIFNWAPALDDQSLVDGLTYQLRAGSGPGLTDIISPPSAPDGYQRVARPGDLFSGTQAVLTGLPDGQYTWAVQAVDPAYIASPFSPERNFQVGTRIARNDEFYTSGSGPVSLPVLQNDNDDYTDLAVLSVTNPQHGTTSIVDNQVVYTPDPNWSGTETVQYYAHSLSTGHCSGAAITIKTPGLYLSPTSVKENEKVNTVVGYFTATPNPAKPNEDFVYHLVCGTGSTDNASFWILDNKLKTSQVFDYEVKNTYYIRVQASGEYGTVYVRQFVISVLHVSANPPTDILLSNSIIQENVNRGSVVGQFTCIDPDEGSTCLFSLETGVGGEDNALFSINQNVLRTEEVFDYETRASYSILVKAKDNTGKSLLKAFSISIANVSDNSPTGIQFSSTAASEMLPPDSVISELTTIDTDPADSFRYQLVSGEGSQDNAAFYFSGSRLYNHIWFDFEKQASYSIRVRSTDQTDRYVEQTAVITILDGEEFLVFIPFSIFEGDGEVLPAP